MFEKVNPGHPDKVADRIAGAVVDLCYTKNKNPKVACEVLIGHGECNIQVETSEQDIETRALIVPQDCHLAANLLSPLWQGGGYKAGVEMRLAA